MTNDLLLVVLLGALLALQSLAIRGYSIVVDSPAQLVLEEDRGPRILAAIGLALLAGVLYIGQVSLATPIGWGWTVREAAPLAGLLVGAVLLRLFERVRIVFESATGTVECTSRLLPWRRFRRPVGEIAQVEVITHEQTYQGQEFGADHDVRLVFRDGRKLVVGRSHDRGRMAGLAARIDAFTR